MPDGDQLPLFETISKEEFEATSKPAAKDPPKRGGTRRKVTTEPRTLEVWFKLPHTMAYCTCSAHEEVQKLLNPTALEYRQRYPVRMVYAITEEIFVCRDCFVAEADK